MVELSDGRTVHVSRIDDKNSELAKEMKTGKIKVINRWKKDWIRINNESSGERSWQS